MATKQTSAQKRHRQSEDRRLRNKAVNSTARTLAKKFVASVHSKDSELAQTNLRLLAKELDTASRKGIISKNAAARKKSRMQTLYNATFSAK